MALGGGLYDRDPEPDRGSFSYAPVPTARVKAAQREWLFWVAMAIGLWAAFQGQPLTVYLVLGTFLVIASGIFLGREGARQWREARSKGKGSGSW
jgi:hypothetical protein